ncbi:MAG: hypothetical protein Q7R69_02840 [bacterium]|nr:hypothetical protein [bacterium]
MKFPPEPKTPYILDKEQDKRIFEKLSKFKNKKLTKGQEELIAFLYTQLEDDWRTPLEEFIDKLLGSTQA